MQQLCNEPEFRKWPKIKRFLDAEMVITQKMDGTNSQILFDDVTSTGAGGFMWAVGSRNKWLTATTPDNFGFYAWVEKNSAKLYEALGPGRHYGEWCGPGIQLSEGLKERKFFSFNAFLGIEERFQALVEPVPILYQGPFSLAAMYDALKDLKENGSKVNGFKPCEGIIVRLSGEKFKLYLDNLDELGRQL